MDKMIHVIYIYFLFNFFLTGLFSTWDDNPIKGIGWFLLGFLFFLPLFLLISLWSYVLEPLLERSGAFFYYYLYFTDKFKEVPKELRDENSKYYRKIKKYYENRS